MKNTSGITFIAILAMAFVGTLVFSQGIVHDPEHDFNTLIHAEILFPTGIWSDGTTMWVADNWVEKNHWLEYERYFGVLYAYNLATKQRDEHKDFQVSALSDGGNSEPRGIWSDGTTMWVADVGGKIYAYNLRTGRWDASEDFNTLINDNPQGIWSDGTTMWVADFYNNGIYAYNLRTKQRDASKEFNTLASIGETTLTGIWSDGTTMWVVDTWNSHIYAYDLATKQRDPSKDITALKSVGNIDPRGIWSDGTTMWVVDRDNVKIYAYDLQAEARARAEASVRKRQEFYEQIDQQQYPIHYAIENYETYSNVISEDPWDIVRSLIIAGHSEKEKNTEGNTPLLLAVKVNFSADFIDNLLNAGAAVNINNAELADADGNVPLHYAVKNNNTRVIQLLINRGAQIDIQNNNGRTPLNFAALYGTQETVNFMKGLQ